MMNLFDAIATGNIDSNTLGLNDYSENGIERAGKLKAEAGLNKIESYFPFLALYIDLRNIIDTGEKPEHSIRLDNSNILAYKAIKEQIAWKQLIGKNVYHASLTEYVDSVMEKYKDLKSEEILYTFEAGNTENMINMVFLVLERVDKIVSDIEFGEIPLLDVVLYVPEVVAMVTYGLYYAKQHEHKGLLKRYINVFLKALAGDLLIVHFVQNNGGDLADVLDILIEQVKTNCTKLVMKSVLRLANLSDSIATMIRMELTNGDCGHELLQSITIQVLKDSVLYFNSTKGMQKFWKSVVDKSDIMRQDVFGHVENNYENVDQVFDVLQYLAMVLGYSNHVLLTDEQVQSICNLVLAGCSLCEKQLDKKYANFGTLSLCIVLLLSINRNANISGKEMSNIMKSLQHVLASVYAVQGNMILLVSLQFYTNQHEVVLEFVNQYCAIQLNVNKDVLINIGEVLFKPRFNEAFMTHELPKTKVISGLSDYHSVVHVNATLRCFFVLLTERSFIRQRVDPTDWILKQVEECTLPYHHLITAIVLQSAKCCCMPIEYEEGKFKNLKSIPFVHIKKKMSRISESHMRDELIDKYDLSKKIVAECSLLLLFMLQFNESCREQKKLSSQKSLLTQYSFHTIPVRFLVAINERYSGQGQLCEYLYPSLLKLVVNECPMIISVPIASARSTLQYYEYISSRNLPKLALAMETFTKFQSCPEDTLELLQILDAVNPRAIIPYFTCIVDHLLYFALDHRPLSALIEPLWKKVIEIHRRPLLLCTSVVQGFMESNNSIPRRKATVNMLLDQMLEEPFGVFRCDARAFSNPRLFSILLDILEYFVTFSQYDMRHNSTKPSSNPQASIVQHCIILHCLFEISITQSNVDIDMLLCIYVEPIFHDYSIILQTIIEQGIPPPLVPTLIKNVPSFIKAFDFIADQLHASKSIAAHYNLLCILLSTYPNHPKASNILTIFIDHLETQITTLTSKKQCIFDENANFEANIELALDILVQLSTYSKRPKTLTKLFIRLQDTKKCTETIQKALETFTLTLSPKNENPVTDGK